MTEQTRPASHLVERVTERLLQSGALEESAALLLGGLSGLGAHGHPAPPDSTIPHDSTVLRDSAALQDGASSALPSDLGQNELAVSRDAITRAQPEHIENADPSLAGGRRFVPAGDDDAPDRDLPAGSITIDTAALEAAGMLDASRARTRMLEEFRLLQRQVLQTAFGDGAVPGFSNLLMVTSARPGEGKSFTSLNLAGSIARQADNFVLLIDADSKWDSICHALGLGKAEGLLDLVANPTLDAGPLIVRTPIHRLSILPVGRERDRCAELFPSKEMVRLVQSIGRRYPDRLIILDAPPCLSTTDPAVLAPVVGQILFVVEANRTQRDEVEASLDLIQACPTISLMLNKQQNTSRYTFGAYSSYYTS